MSAVDRISIVNTIELLNKQMSTFRWNEACGLAHRVKGTAFTKRLERARAHTHVQASGLK
jgi:hypothetical protein